MDSAKPFSLMRVSLSAKGFELIRNIMRLNETLAELAEDHLFLGEGLYYITIMGTHIREYQAQLFTVHKSTPGTVTNRLCALRFLYIQTLKRAWSIADTPYPNKRYRLPTVLGQEEVTQLVNAAPTPIYRTILMTLYGTGAAALNLRAYTPHSQRSRASRRSVSPCIDMSSFLPCLGFTSAIDSSFSQCTASFSDHLD